MPLIEARDLFVRIGKDTILEQVSMSVFRGEIVTIVGPNGAGKTILIRALLGLIPPSKGAITRQPNLRIGYVPQKLIFDQTMPLHVCRFLGLTGRASRMEIDSVLAELKIETLKNEMVFNLSGGELQRLLIARALLGSPDILILDEPVQGVDIGGQQELYRLIADVRKNRNCGILMISHDLHMVMAATDNVICLNRHICCSGHPESVSKNPAYLTLFGGSAVKDIAIYTHQHDHRHAPSGEIINTAPANEDASGG